ncbi:hypothetical protein ACVW1A_006783 [Bradyrhizobium sp. LB1.3]
MRPAETRCSTSATAVLVRPALAGNDSSLLQNARFPKREFAKPPNEPAPPDRGRRPTRANREPPVLVDTWAAANSESERRISFKSLRDAGALMSEDFDWDDVDIIVLTCR